ncbi:MAG: response regulator [Bdellovibrionaceae bacterium]|nr:response regulator [Pseudobdellovibrionaceae bacterium]
MALRVLLADESQTIKKVIQLALQDFSVEVKPVHSGIDVLPIAKVFQPDIIFADVLLAKKSGYDVSKELKNNSETSQIPIVLMWNSLMGIDEKKALESKADRRLEKPFEVETLRQMVQELAPKTATNPISSFLNFGEIESFKDLNKEIQQKKAEMSSSALDEAIPGLGLPTDFNLPGTPEGLSLQVDDEEFAQVPLTSSSSNPFESSHITTSKSKSSILEKTNSSSSMDAPAGLNFSLPNKLNVQKEDFLRPDSDNNEKDEWSQQKINTLENYSLPEEDLKKAKVQITDDFEEIIFNEDLDEAGTPKTPQLNSHLNHTTGESFSTTESGKMEVPRIQTVKEPLYLDLKAQEKIIREESRAIIEKICWTLLPDIAERVVREEIKKLLQEAEKSI